MTAQTDDIEYDDNDDVTDTDTDGADEWTPPTREDYERLLAEHRKANAQAASRKRLLRDLGYDKNGQRVAPERDDDAATTTNGEPARSDTAAVERGIAKKYEAIYSGLATAGVPAGQLARVARLIDASAVSVDEDGVEGLAEQIESLKADYADFFKRPRAKATDAAVVGSGRKAVTPAVDADPLKAQILARMKAGQL
jgi:hypothetical protein